MTTQGLLNAAARAYALVCHADGKLSSGEELRFASAMSEDPAFRSTPPREVKAALARAVEEVAAAGSFAGPIASIASAAAGPDDKAAVMRMAQVAIVADRRIEAQESGCLAALAEAMGLDPDAY